MTTAPPAFPPRRSLSIDRTILFVTLMVALGLVLIAQLWYLQVATGAQYLERADTNRLRVETEKPLRGVIYDRNGTILAENRPAYQLELVPEQVRDLDATLRGLVEIGLFTPDDIDD
ncbi:MAG: penicillin-binding protein 2, partial [Proteobacteria bacterium]|nr:penicillin-binding protein 2 [Pseudomonadota bacterium]